MLERGLFIDEELRRRSFYSRSRVIPKEAIRVRLDARVDVPAFIWRLGRDGD
jgi:hypothetical protein